MASKGQVCPEAETSDQPSPETIKKLDNQHLAAQSNAGCEASTSNVEPMSSPSPTNLTGNSNEIPTEAELPEGTQSPAEDFLAKYERAAPYHLFFTAVEKESKTKEQPLSVTFHELLDTSLGKIVNSFHSTFWVDIEWLENEYADANQEAKMLVFYDKRWNPDEPVPQHISTWKVKVPDYGSHHTKMSILHYEDNGIRIIVSTANLTKDDYTLSTQSLWMSPHLPQLPESERDNKKEEALLRTGESETGFKTSLFKYFATYGRNINEWKTIILHADFSSIKVAFVASVPGEYPDGESSQWGHRRLATVLANHAEVPKGKTTTIVAVASSIGSLGSSYQEWLSNDLVDSMSKAKNQSGKQKPDCKVIYPTIENHKCSYNPSVVVYEREKHKEQKWIEKYMYQWKADRNYRTKALPHTKTYVRFSADEQKAAWMVVGSANLSKAAWGYLNPRKKNIYTILNYEASVVFLPKFIINGSTHFPVGTGEAASSDSEVSMLPIPYDLPLTRYRKDDRPALKT